VKRGSTAQAARCFKQSLSALGCSSKTLRRVCRWYTATTTVLMRVPYRQFPIRTSGNGGTFSAPVSARISSPIAQNAGISREKPGTAFCLPKLALPARADRVSLTGNSPDQAQSRRSTGSARRVTTALRTGSDAAQSQRISRISLRSTSLAPARLTAREHPTASA
jgi:hypothetical protein